LLPRAAAQARLAATQHAFKQLRKEYQPSAATPAAPPHDGDGAQPARVGRSDHSLTARILAHMKSSRTR
jgi:hypothetical protein